MGLKFFLGVLFVCFAIILFLTYWFIPFNEIVLSEGVGSSNFTIIPIGVNSFQFYDNMRYSELEISYKIENCPVAKKANMIEAFGILDDLTVLNFFPVESDEDISVTCDEKSRMEEGLFIAGEGGPTNITKAGDLNVILHGSILLIRESKCERPNVAIHELLHALGFDHSLNKNNIMYNYSKCSQTIGDDIIKLIDKLYYIKSLPDLVIQNVSAKMKGKYLDTSFTVRNNGLKNAGISKMIISADGDEVKEIDIDALDIGYGTQIGLSNVWISQISIDELKYEVVIESEELDKNNNAVTLVIN